MFQLLLPPQGKYSFLCFSLGLLPRETVLQEPLQSESFPQASVLHDLLQCGSLHRVQFLRSSLLQWGHKSCQKILTRVASSLHGSTGPCQESAPAWPSLMPSFGYPPAPAWSFTMLRRMDICSFGENIFKIWFISHYPALILIINKSN